MADYAYIEGTRSRIYPDSEPDKNYNCVCPACNRPVTWISGAKNGGKPYFRHARNTHADDCLFYQKQEQDLDDNWMVKIIHHTGALFNGEHEYEGMSNWHKGWQEEFDSSEREKNIRDTSFTYETSHRADALLGKVVLEFQHTHISAEDFIGRSQDWLNAGFQIVWLLDYRGIGDDEYSILVNDGICKFIVDALRESNNPQPLEAMSYLALDCGRDRIVLLSEIENVYTEVSSTYRFAIKEVLSRKRFIQRINAISRTGRAVNYNRQMISAECFAYDCFPDKVNNNVYLVRFIERNKGRFFTIDQDGKEKTALVDKEDFERLRSHFSSSYPIPISISYTGEWNGAKYKNRRVTRIDWPEDLN